MGTEHDETPETSTQTTEEEVPPGPDPEQVAHQEGEKVPAWGQSLIDKVEALAASLAPSTPVVEPPEPDESPRREPWHRRNPLKG